MGRAWLRARSVCTSPFPVLVCGVGVRAGVWVSAAPRLSLGGCWGVCVLVRPCRVVPCTSWLGVLCGGACLCVRPACSPPFLAGACCVGVRAGSGFRLCPALLGWVVGVCFTFFFFFCFVVSVAGCPCPGPCGPCPPIPSLSGWVAGSFFFFFFRAVCVCALWVSLFPVGRFSWLGVAGYGWVVPLCPFGGPVFGAFWVGGLAASCGVGGRFGGCGPVSRPPPLPSCFLFFFFFGGGVCLFLPLPSLGWRTHWPAFSVVFRVAVGGCVLLGPVPAPWVGWVMYTLGSAPLPAGLGPGSAGWAAAPGGFVWLWVRGAEVVRVLSPPRCRF